MSVTRRFIAAVFGVFCSAASLLANQEWQVTRFEGRDYLSVEQIAAFCGFCDSIPPVSEIAPSNPAEPLTKKLSINNGSEQIGVTLNSREVELNGVRHWLGFPVIEQGDKLMISRLDFTKIIEPALRPEAIENLHPVRTIVLDAGHGGHDKGAVSRYGAEKDFALDVCLRAKPILEARGFKVLLTRQSDVFIPLEERPRIANREKDCIFVSVHFNCADRNSDATGFEIFSMTPRGAPSSSEQVVQSHQLRSEPGNVLDAQSAALSTSIYHSVLGNIPEVDRGIKQARFAVIRLATVPAVLIEGGFVTNPNDIRFISSPSWRGRLAEAIVEGIEGYKHLAENKQRPKVVAEYRRIAPDTVAANGGSTAPEMTCSDSENPDQELNREH